MMYKNNFVVSVKCNGRILREMDGSVYLPFGSEYSLLIKNMDSRRAVVDIEVDGESALKGKLIVEGNTAQEVKGFMRDMSETNRFKFIEKTSEISKHRGDRIDDGLVRVEYQFEAESMSYIPSTTYYVPHVTYWDSGHYGTTYCGGSVKSLNSSEVTCSFNCSTQEDGITVKGNKIKQDYSYGFVGLLEKTKNVIVLQLKGQTDKMVEVKKPLTVKTKISCVTCGRKNRSSNKFCYNCGTYLS